MSKTVYVQDYYTVIEQFYNGVVEPKMQLEEFITKKDEIIQGIKDGAFQPAMLEKDEIIYHYTSLDGLKAILDSGVMQITDFHYLNDETEFQYMDELLFKIIREEFGGTPSGDSLIASVIEYRLTVRAKSENLKDSYCVLSVSQQQDNLTLWAEFASYGCNMGVMPDLFLKEYGDKRYIGPVIYDVEEQKEMILKAIRVVMEYFFPEVSEERPLRGYLKLVDEQQVCLLAVPIVELVSYYGMVMKNPLYKAENECRMVFSIGEQRIRYKRKKNLFVPYIEVPLNMDDGFAGLRSVTLAPLCRGTLERNSLEQYLRSLGIKGTEVKQSEIVLRY